MQERRKADRRQTERRTDRESARNYLGMQRRLVERRRGERRRLWAGYESSACSTGARA